MNTKDNAQQAAKDGASDVDVLVDALERTVERSGGWDALRKRCGFNVDDAKDGAE